MDIQKMLDDYAAWLRDEISVEEMGDYYELTTPYLDRFNDYIQFYVKADKDGTMNFTDDGYTIGNLQSSGAKVSSGSVLRDMIQEKIHAHGFQLRGNDIVGQCDSAEFPQKKHMMVQTMLLVDDMFQPKISTRSNEIYLFPEVVAEFFDENEIIYTRDVSLLGKTGSVYTYDFFFQRTKNKPDRFCQAINSLNESNRNLSIFNWIDTKDKRKDTSLLYILVNDSGARPNVQEKDLTALEKYDICPLLYSKKNETLTTFCTA